MALLVLLVCSAWDHLSQQDPDDSSGLAISEIMASGNDIYPDEDGDYPDWIEIHNESDQPVNLSGMALTDDPQQPDKWMFPDLTLPGDGYLVVFASGKDRRGSASAPPVLHANFSLNQDGEFLGLFNLLDEQYEDHLIQSYPANLDGLSYGLQRADGPPVYFDEPTPGKANDGASVAGAGIVSPVMFSAGRGFYDQPFLLELSVDTPGATIRYTTDGGEPTADHGYLYTEPIHVSGTAVIRAAASKLGWIESYVVSHTYLFIEDVLHQPADPVGYPAAWGICLDDMKDLDVGDPIPADYEMDPDIVDDPRYHDPIRAGLTDIPSLSLVMSRQDFLDLYSNTRMRGREWERPVSVELIDPSGKQPGFQTNGGIRIHGNAARQENVRKHSFRLYFRTEYGAGKLEYPLFPNSSVTEFDTLVLRAGTDRSYAGLPEGWQYNREATYTEDEWLRETQVAMSGIGSHGFFVHLFINGLYWGLYNVVERPDAAFAASYLGGTKDEWFAINDGGVIDGNPAAARETLNFALLDTPEQRFAALAPRVDASAFSDYILLNWYAGTRDWPHNNWYAVTHGLADKIRFLVWDGERTWVKGANLNLGKSNPDAWPWPNLIKPVFETLMWDPDFGLQFADRMYEQLFNGGPLSDASSLLRWRQLNASIENAIVVETARWGDAREEAPLTQEDWKRSCAKVEARMSGNAARLAHLAREASYYPIIDPPEFSPEADQMKIGSTLTMTASTGIIFYTTDGSDPRLSGGGTSPSAQVYRHSIRLQEATPIKARTKIADEWSVLRTANFQVVPVKSQLVISELMYNPLGGSEYEFIELENVSDMKADLAGFHFDEGIEFEFPAGIEPLEAGQHAVIVKTRRPLASNTRRYPFWVPTGENSPMAENASHLETPVRRFSFPSPTMTKMVGLSALTGEGTR